MMKHAIIAIISIAILAGVVAAQVSPDGSSVSPPSSYTFQNVKEGLAFIASQLDILIQGVRICGIVLLLILGTLHFRIIILSKNQSRWW